MRIGIFCNHSKPLMGGCEKIVDLISSSMVNDFGHKCTVMSISLKNSYVSSGVQYIPCPTNQDEFLNIFRSKIFDYIFVYSDCFCHYQLIIKNRDQIPCNVGVSLVGASTTTKLGMDKCDNVNYLVHSNIGADFDWCTFHGIRPAIIPNGVDFMEFKSNGTSFKDKYGITTGKMILCVSNFFPGKGQLYLPDICRDIYWRYRDFTLVCVNSTGLPMTAIYREKLKNVLRVEDFSSIILTDISREDVIDAFIDADVFLFPSQKEVAPLVILEAMASKTPWVSLPVGNTRELKGGIIVANENISIVNMSYIFTDLVQKRFSDSVYKILSDNELSCKLASEGYDNVVSNYSWDKVKVMYNKFFSGD